jgi:hypothetical protein
MESLMPTTLRLKGPVRVSHTVNPDDVVSVKRALTDLDLYDTGGMAPNGVLDQRLLGGVEAFQRTHGLTVDRVVNPGGETERSMNAALLQRKVSRPTQQVGQVPAMRAHGQPDPRAPRQGTAVLQPVQQPSRAVPDMPAFAPENRRPPRTAHIPEFGQVDDWRDQFRDMLGRPYEPYAMTVGDRLLAMPSSEARQEAEQVAGIPVPWYRSEAIDPAAWATWAATLNEDPSIGPTQRRVFLEIFAAEGGFEPASDNPAATVAGMTGGTDGVLRTLAPGLGLSTDVSPRDLTVLQLIAAYRAYFDQDAALGRVGGSARLEQISDIAAAVLLADTLFRNGTGTGVDIIQGAINAVSPGRVREDGIFGEESLGAYLELMADRETRELLRNEIQSRRNDDIREETRNAYMSSL